MTQDKPEKPDLKPDFLSIASPLVKRGFRITPVHPETKAGCMNNLHGETTIEGLQKWVKNYSDYNVGVVSKRGVGRLMFFDDDSGIAARIEQETGEKIPATYRVQTRPDTNPLKQHFYFKQTEYSFKKFATFADGGNPWNSKNVNRKDLTKFTLSRSRRIADTPNLIRLEMYRRCRSRCRRGFIAGTRF